MRRTIALAGLAALGIAFGLGLAACDDETADAAGIRGTVVDVAGDPVDGAVVSVYYDLWSGIGGRAPAGPAAAAAAGDVDPIVPVQFDLRQNYPNPFYPATRIEWELPQACQARLEIRDRSGRTLRVLVDATLPAGRHSVVWNGRDDLGEALPNGWYACRLGCWDSGTGERLYTETVGGLFLDGIDIQGVGPLALTDADGRFFLPFPELPLGLEIPLTDETGAQLGTRTVGPDLQIEAARGVARGHREIRVVTTRQSLFVTIELASPAR